jgi:hypothetical protein
MILAQALPPSALEQLKAIHQQFSEGDSGLSLLLLVAGIVALVLALHYGSLLWQRHRRRGVYHPGRLFAEVLAQLRLGVSQRDLLRRMARELELKHPVMLVLSPHLFQQHANRWMVTTRRAVPAVRAELNALSAAVFGS